MRGREVTKVVEVEKEVEKVVTATPVLLLEAPMLHSRVLAGDLPPLAERLPEDPEVVAPLELGEYGGDWNRFIVVQLLPPTPPKRW